MTEGGQQVAPAEQNRVTEGGWRAAGGFGIITPSYGYHAGCNSLRIPNGEEGERPS